MSLKKKKFSAKKSSSFRSPPGLKKGDSVALIRPSSLIEESKYEASKTYLQELGLFVAEFLEPRKHHSFFASDDEWRAKELNWAFSEPGIKAVFCCRGGYGVARALRLIEAKKYRRWVPKLVFGYSDITYLHQWIQNQLGWKAFHSPLVGMLDKKEVRTFVNDVFEFSSKPTEEVWNEVKLLRKGRAQGRLVGGNLSLFETAGPAAIPKKPIILAIEEVNEDFYRIDRMLQRLGDAGYSPFIKAIIVGTLKACGKGDEKSFGLSELKNSFLSLSSGPVWWGGCFGHGLKEQRILCLGSSVQINDNRLKYREAFISKN